MGSGVSRQQVSYQYQDEIYIEGQVPEEVPENKMKKLPHRLIGIILSEDESGKVGVGTGILISPDLVLTVAHNIYNFEGKKEYHKISFCPGHSGPIGDKKEVKSWYYPEAFKQDNSPKNDIALMRLAEKTEETEFIPIKECMVRPNGHEHVALHGYPTLNNQIMLDPNDPYNFKIYQMGLIKGVQSIQQINIENEEIIHKISTEGGESGAPIILIEENKLIRIIGVHKGGVQNKQVNVGKLITAAVITQLKQQADKMGACPFQVAQEDVYFQKAELLRKQGRWQEAQDFYEKTISIQIRHPSAYCGKALVLLSLKKYKQALVNAEEAISIDQNNAAAINIMGAAHYFLKNYEEALKCYQKMIVLQPQNAQTHMKLSSTFHALGKYQEQREHLRIAEKLDSDNPDLLNSKGCLLVSERKIEKAIALFRKGLEIKPRDRTLHYNLGSALRQKGQYKEAMVSLKTALEIDPTDAAAHNDIGLCHFMLNNIREAEQQFKLAIQMDPSSKASCNNYIRTLRRDNSKATEGIKFLAKIKSKYPQCKEVRDAYQKLASVQKSPSESNIGENPSCSLSLNIENLDQ